MLMAVAVRPKTTLVIVWVESDEAEEDMLRRQLVWWEGARRRELRKYEGIKAP